jgi:hypothetical protein
LKRGEPAIHVSQDTSSSQTESFSPPETNQVFHKTACPDCRGCNNFDFLAAEPDEFCHFVKVKLARLFRSEIFSCRYAAGEEEIDAV